MPFVSGFLSIIDRSGRPIDPEYGVEGPETQPPGIWPSPGHPGHLPSWRPGGGRPDQSLPRPPRPPHVWPRPPSGGLPVDPDWGVDEGAHPDHGLPIYPLDPEHPDNALPEVPGEPPPEVDPPPGTIWPPLPPEIPPGKAIVLVAISGVGYRYAVITIPEHHPDQGLPAPPVRPGQPLPRPPQPGQGLPRPPVAPTPTRR
jgi:hypothetical protein